MTAGAAEVIGRLVLEDRVEPGRLIIADGHIVRVDLDPVDPTIPRRRPALVCPGFVDVHVHGWGGHDAMGDRAALDGMALALASRGVTSFLPTAVTAPLDDLARFADGVRGWRPNAPSNGAQPLGFNLEGPFLAPARRGAHDPNNLRRPVDVSPKDLEPLLDGLRLLTIAPELPGALELVGWLSTMGVAVSLGHSGATLAEARAGYAAGASSTTHLFNAMSGMDHRSPGLAAAALLQDEAYVELIADDHHVEPALWQLVMRAKPEHRLVLVSDAIALAGTGIQRGRIGSLEVEVDGSRVTLAGTTTLAGSVLSLDVAVRNLVGSGASLPYAAKAASRNPLALLGIADRGRLAAGLRADLVELDDDLRVRRVMIGGRWLD
ncbi:MAG TPA: N-acetylglucosamine-6-phosphate deacetylase [Candidatus Limnocylindrales bacterium]|nr:N-acetylglucosamine-6-phosphate deacetylase [Candidatus Limnocylindrales bacterium]